MVPDQIQHEVHIAAPIERVEAADEQAAHARDNLPGWTGGFAGLRTYAQRVLT